jgi:hypothetical protein
MEYLKSVAGCGQRLFYTPPENHDAGDYNNLKHVEMLETSEPESLKGESSDVARQAKARRLPGEPDSHKNT